MKVVNKTIAVIALTTVMGLLLIGCTGGGKAADPAQSSNSSTTDTTAKGSANEETASTEQASTRTYKDYKGHQVDIPAAPKAVVFAGETTGDLIELNIPMIGIYGDELKGRVYQEKAASIENVGFPINLEKVTSLNPDLIIVGDTDEKIYEQLSKIAPTIMFDTFGSLDYRMKELGTIFDKKTEVEAWLQAYNKKAEEMWKQLYATVLKPGETASVFTYYPGDRLFVMARAGLPQFLYAEGGFKPTAPIQGILDANEGFREISAEKINEFAGDRIFILDPVNEEAKQSTEALLKSPVWKTLPAVKQGKVYRMYIQRSDSDANTRQWMLEELPKMLGK
ncbi:ABC transporter substrate-binding protein [Paenibacillus sp. UMB4589-SE434]|uniref:ABC transporter substrate-binding protein n=1 Tax=Paenibacillus sp. UMB4589-SE434 TaxID=3046314 RepID=UPI00254E06DD|nr:ABC transporter substrate-binding protein [Paenibacillus sp. UMB4589-SE434]MDK8179871.1 ABC transporter substrate-binding protein [Paenibacillus sp. UMB4589-SE434]